MATQQEIKSIIFDGYNRIWGQTPPSFEALCYQYFDKVSPEDLRKVYEAVMRNARHTKPSFRDFNLALAELKTSQGLEVNSKDEMLRQIYAKSYKAQRLRDDYVLAWTKSNQAEECRKGGFYSNAYHYIHEAAWLQANIVCDARNFGFDAMKLGYTGQNRKEIESQVSELVRIARVEGRVEVPLPITLLGNPPQILEETGQGEENKG